MAVIVQSSVKLFQHVFVQFSNLYVNSAVFAVGVGTIVSPQITIVLFEPVEIDVHQSAVTQVIFTDPYQELFTEIVAWYWFTKLVNCAVYSWSPCTAEIVGLHLENVYVYWAVAAFFGVAEL